MADAVTGERLAEDMTFVGRAIVGHDALDLDAMGLEESERPFEEGGHARLLLVGQDFGVGEPGGVIDGDVEGLSAEALATGAATALAASIAGDTVTDAVYAAQLLGIDMDQFAGLVPLVADDRHNRLESLEPAKSEPRQRLRHRRDRPPEPTRDRWPRQPLTPQCLNLGLRRLAQPGRG